MSSENVLAQVIQHIAHDTEEATKPTTLEFGEVISAEYMPLEIRIHDKLILDEAFLELTNAVKDHWLDIEVYWETIDDNDLLEFQTNHYKNIATQNANVEIHNANAAKYNLHTHTNGNMGAPTGTLTTPDEMQMEMVKPQTQRHTSHLHNIAGRKKIRVYNGLHTGEKVVLLRMRGGQKYLVLDRITPHIVGGEWRTHAGAVTTDQETLPFEVTDKKVLSGWKEGAKSESKWANFSKPAEYQAGAEFPEEKEGGLNGTVTSTK